MKYCSKCGEQNPDEAKFCKKCGDPLSQLSFTKKEKYDSLQKDREGLSETYQVLITFFKERKKLYEKLSNNDNYESAIKISIGVIEHNKAVRYELYTDCKKKKIIAGIISAIVSILIFAYCIHWAWENQAREIVDNIAFYSIFDIVFGAVGGVLQILICICFSSIPLVSIYVIDDIYSKRISESWVSYENEFTQTFLTPFIQKHEEAYEIINASLYDEICEPDKITQVILQKIEEIENRIKELDKEMQLLVKT